MFRSVITLQPLSGKYSRSEYPRTYYGNGCRSVKHNSILDEIQGKGLLTIEDIEKFLYDKGLRVQKITTDYIPLCEEFVLLFFDFNGKLESVEKMERKLADTCNQV